MADSRGRCGWFSRFNGTLSSKWLRPPTPSPDIPVRDTGGEPDGLLAIGYLGGLLQFRSLLGPSQRLFLLIGFLGGFTTFSTFAYETLTLAQGSEFLKAAFNITAHVMLGLTAAWLGYFSAQNL